MGSISLSNSLPITRVPLLTSSLNHLPISSSTSFSLFSPPLSNRRRSSTFSPSIAVSAFFSAPASVNNNNNSVPARNGGFTVGDFMTPRQNLHVVKPSTSVDDALELLVEKKVTGLPVIDDDWTLVGVVSDYDLLALDSISGRSQSDANLFPDVDSTWKTFNELQKLISKTYGKFVGDLMTPSPLVVRDSTNLEDAARLLLETKFRRLPVVDADGKLIGILTRGNVVRAALQIKREAENST
ncbi:PREDICTED: CBS domain-containing protein CBSX2, chloroplastic-like [Camelina sativa]|uniref:CBS domain-containing protein CBSX2, chloroplastic-like n=1 Tax=Camelina sativa TaxID=90675 RepID=A0ABM0TWF1_CAMSA|nr:PREDICTED: CBS domain-containing protein CBSX2, chloroplastic-like [Camelina sativa]